MEGTTTNHIMQFSAVSTVSSVFVLFKDTQRCTSFGVTNQVTHPYKTAGNIMVLNSYVTHCDDV